ncbi:MAG: hypothetical protein HLUCCO17_13505 [Saliniramus fredricksonii]|uniref:Signaling protein n=1 Tax=Saliniramus fredricksonii TaxID=1653334 RepID=A0A0P7Y0E5_9HYPH|nr:hypothetical protein [Saliniramus fredricksonii]KPQ09775.1 MAG: hypothetical protein HLUCCO17_13505 [Saliniramus fredricksonii]SCC80654.1 hypothetical protein GA0071312_1620 [Saliniramus fredricksonii]
MSRTNSRNLRATVTVLSALVFVATQVLGVAVAAGWAIAGIFELGDTIGYVLMGLFSGLGLYMLHGFWKQATRIEPLNKPD